MTVSIGIATAWPGDPNCPLTSVERLTSAADTALYRAKRTGRDRATAAAGRVREVSK